MQRVKERPDHTMLLIDASENVYSYLVIAYRCDRCEILHFNWNHSSKITIEILSPSVIEEHAEERDLPS